MDPSTFPSWIKTRRGSGWGYRFQKSPGSRSRCHFLDSYFASLGLYYTISKTLPTHTARWEKKISCLIFFFRFMYRVKHITQTIDTQNKNSRSHSKNKKTRPEVDFSCGIHWLRIFFFLIFIVLIIVLSPIFFFCVRKAIEFENCDQDVDFPWFLVV